MIGKSHQKNILGAFQIDNVAVELIILTLLGALAVLVRAKLRIPLNMPGHHGLEVMALFLIGRSISKISVASTITSLSASIFILFPFMGLTDPFLPAIYLLMGLFIDVFYKLISRNEINIILISLLGGLAYSIIPLSRILIHFTTGYPYQLFIKSGFVIPVISHFVFGVAGALLAAGILSTTNKIRK